MTSEDPPILEFDPSPNAVVEPGALQLRRDDAPRCAVMCFFGEVIRRLAEEGTPVLWELRAAHGVHPVYGVEADGETVAVFHPGVGAPLASAFFEEAIETGCRAFVAIGMAGGLIPQLTIGNVTVPTGAIRDEGTSYHYAPPSREIGPTPGALRTIEETLARRELPYVAGRTWTTDAPYRETRGKVERRVAEGCITVEMEASALFAVAAFRDVPLGMMFLTSDDLCGETWDGSGFHTNLETRELLLDVAIEAVLRL
jgi:uridine phosphorylase